MHVFFKKRYLKIYVWYNMFCALVPRSRRARIAPTTPLGIALTHFRECMFTTGGREQWICLGEHLTFYHIWDLDLWILKSDKMSGFLTGGFLAPYPRWWITYTPGNASEQSLGVLWELINEYDGQTRAQSERTGDVVIIMDFEMRFLKKTCIFWSRICVGPPIWRGQRGGIKNPLNLICSMVIQIPRNEFIAQTDQKPNWSPWLKKIVTDSIWFLLHFPANGSLKGEVKPFPKGLQSGYQRCMIP